MSAERSRAHPKAGTRRLGRPPATSSAETRQRILAVARAAFAELGYGVTTNKYVAAKAGITTGALYHYFDSKLDMYRAVYEDVQYRVTQRLGAVITQDTFLGQFEALLEESHELNREDPSLARFLASARIDIGRHDELRNELGSPYPGQGRQFTPQLVKLGIATGEIDPSRRREMEALIRTVLVGLVDAVSDDQRDHRRAIDAVVHLMKGELVHPPRPAGRAVRAR